MTSTSYFEIGRLPTLYIFGIILFFYYKSDAAAVQSHTFRWKKQNNIHYVKCGSDECPPLLLLPGFGVGTFHFERNYDDLAKHFCVYSIDLLGQGKSWPEYVTVEDKYVSYHLLYPFGRDFHKVYLF
jgi:pimeloyl-ACP methyl ester carboxylesterase